MARYSWTFSNRRALAASLIVLLGMLAAPHLLAQTLVQIEGAVQDVEGDPVVGARVVYRLIDSEGVFISQPTDGAGRYLLELPSGERCHPVAVVVSDGTRVALGEVAPARAVSGMSQQITIDIPRE